MKKPKLLSKIISFLLCLSMPFCFFAFNGCVTDNPPVTPPDDNPPVTPPDDTPVKTSVTVTFIANDANALSASSSFSAERGENAEFILPLTDGYCVKSLVYSGSYSLVGAAGNVLVRLDSVRYDETVTVITEPVDRTINYNLNGGSLINATSLPFEVYSESGYSAHHLRKNTSIGINTICRAGYTQIGWNTSPDGTGAHIGLGSRVTVEKGQKLNLYAEWAQWTDASLFDYSVNQSGGATITGYRGSGGTLVIPEQIENSKVTAIGAHLADGLSFDKFVIHRYIKSVGDNTGCKISHLYICDTVSRLENGGFGCNVSTCHINAATAPTFLGSFGACNIPDGIDRLILNYNTNKKNMVFFGGCNIFYGLDCSIIDNGFNGEYLVTNLGINSDYDMTYQLECILPYLKSGDVFVDIPEPPNPRAMFATTAADENCEWEVFASVEGNFDLISNLDFTKFGYLLKNLEDYNAKRANMRGQSYESYDVTVNEYGDYISERGSQLTGHQCFVQDESTVVYDGEVLAVGAATLNAYFKAISAKGVSVCFSFLPINEGALEFTGEYDSEEWLNYLITFNTVIDSNYITVISDPADYIFNGAYIFDTDYHLTSAGAVLRSQQLMSDLKDYLK